MFISVSFPSLQNNFIAISFIVISTTVEPERRKNIAVVGAGPAGLSCAVTAAG